MNDEGIYGTAPATLGRLLTPIFQIGLPQRMPCEEY